MTKIITQSDSEYAFNKNQFKDKLKRFIISPPLSLREKTIYMNELLKFSKRNNLIPEMGVCCPNCFKAHALAKAEESNLSNELIKAIEKSFNCEAGHNGYYLDGEELKLIKN